MRQVFLLDLTDEAVAATYELAHRPGSVPEQVLGDIRASGISSMEIYCFEDRLVMVTEMLRTTLTGDRSSSLHQSNGSAAWMRFNGNSPERNQAPNGSRPSSFSIFQNIKYKEIQA